MYEDDLYLLLFALFVTAFPVILIVQAQKKSHNQKSGKTAAGASPAAFGNHTSRPAVSNAADQGIRTDGVLPQSQSTEQDIYAGSMGDVSSEGKDPCHPRLTNEDVYAGSMGDISQEGTDPCHPEHEVYRPFTEEPAPEISSSQWTGSDLVRGMMMKEILTRPSERHRRT